MSDGTPAPAFNFPVRLKDEWIRAGCITRSNAHWITLDFAKRANLALQTLTPPRALAFDDFLPPETDVPSKTVKHCVVVDLQVAVPNTPEGYITLPNFRFHVIPEGGIHFEWSIYLQVKNIYMLIEERRASQSAAPASNAASRESPQAPSHAPPPSSDLASAAAPQVNMQQPSAQPSSSSGHKVPAELLFRILHLACSESHGELKVLCQLNRQFQERFEARLYRHVDLLSLPALERFIEALDARPQRALDVQHLAIGPSKRLEPAHAKSIREGGALPDDALVIQRLRNLRRLLVQTGPACSGWCRGMLELPKLTELHVFNMSENWRYLPSLIEEQDELLRVIGEQVEAQEGIECPKSKEMLRKLYGSRLPLERIEIFGYFGALSFLAQLASVKEIVINGPDLDGIKPTQAAHMHMQTPNIRILPRSSLELLLNSPRLERLTVQDTPLLLERIAHESGPLSDPRIRLRPLVDDIELDGRGLDPDEVTPALYTDKWWLDWSRKKRRWREEARSDIWPSKRVREEEAGMHVPEKGVFNAHFGMPWISLPSDIVSLSTPAHNRCVNLVAQLCIDREPDPEMITWW